MELTFHTDYGLRTLMYAASHQDRRVTMREIAGAYQISLDHLRKVVHRLAQNGYLLTSKGRGGGLTLARSPEHIRVGELVTVMEESMNIVDCHRQPCPLCGACSLKQAFDSARDAFIDRLNEFTLAGLLENMQTATAILKLRACDAGTAPSA